MLPDDGQIVTESAAMTLLLADLAASTALVAAIYPAFSYADVPTRFVPQAEAAGFRVRVGALKEENWRLVEAEATRRGGPWFLGARMTALDIYIMVMVRVMVMVHWTPREDWLRAEAPHLTAFAPVMQRNFG